ncbi:MAG TPA: LptF/LptG family permease [Gemmatimonadales bacterium]|nr:LptF/LptG family permease [Gemmatimonadales bacterium]
MSILSRYLLRLHFAPFAFALGALTGFMLLNQIARRLGELVGKGLPWSVVIEVFALSIPFIVAMTLPMAVLVAVLYAMSRLAGDSEITALRAGGISLGRLLRPLLLAGAVVAGLAFLFTDHLLPRSNHRLRMLYSDIARKKPTFSIKEQVVNEVQRNRLFLRAAMIDPATYALRDVTIYDLADQDRKRVIYADSGYLAVTEDQKDAHLTLYSGVMHEFDRSDPAMFQQVAFDRDLIRIEGVGDTLILRGDDPFKSDREMSICEMEKSVRNAERTRALARIRLDGVRLNGLRALVGLAAVPPDTALPTEGPSPYCRALERWATWLLPAPLAAQQAPGGAEAIRRVRDKTAPRVRARPEGTSAIPRANEVRSFEDQVRRARGSAAHFLVEIHKKFVISSACLVFVLVGVPIAIRFPRGGMGLVIGVSLAIFAIYYIGLIAGESLADRLAAPPWILWVPNAFFSTVGLLMLYRSHRSGVARRRARAGAPA